MQTFFIFSKNKTLFKASDNGFCLFSLIWGALWGIYKGLWEASIFNLLLLSFFGYFAENSIIIFILISNVFWGFFGKDMYIQKLLNKNYLPKSALNAPSREKALIIYFAENKNEISVNN
jgi:hypothetical protein|tara:strand:- start:122 stop:478 length:357 start_codon:yes stop_codon:yes gene_type:complete